MNAVPNYPCWDDWVTAMQAEVEAEPDRFVFGSDRLVELLRETSPALGNETTSTETEPRTSIETVSSLRSVSTEVTVSTDVPVSTEVSVSAEQARHPALRFARQHGYAPDRLLTPRELAVWGMRREIADGQRQPAHVNAAALDGDVPEFVRVYWEAFVDCVACRWSHSSHYGNPAVFTHVWAVAWCSVVGYPGFTVYDAKRARRDLVARGWMLLAGRARYALWLPRVDE